MRICFASLLVLNAVTGVALAQDKVTIGVSVPAADHGWTGGVNYFAQQAIDRLKTTYPNVDFVTGEAVTVGRRAGAAVPIRYWVSAWSPAV